MKRIKGFSLFQLLMFILILSSSIMLSINFFKSVENKEIEVIFDGAYKKINVENRSKLQLACRPSEIKSEFNCLLLTLEKNMKEVGYCNTLENYCMVEDIKCSGLNCNFVKVFYKRTNKNIGSRHIDMKTEYVVEEKS